MTMQDNDPVSLTYGQLTDFVERVEQIPTLSGAGAPTASTPAFYKGQMYLDTTENKTYICTDTTNPYVWEEVGASGITELTSADYNYHSSGETDDGVALWLLPPGLYYRDTSKTSGQIKIYHTSAQTYGYSNEQDMNCYLVEPSSQSGYMTVHAFGNGIMYNSSPHAHLIAKVYVTSGTGSIYRVLTTNSIKDNLTSTATDLPLSANQGKVLKGLIDDNVGKARELTSADYNWNSTAGDATTTPFDCVALWLLPSGTYIKSDNVAARVAKNKTISDNGPYVTRRARSGLTGVVINLSHDSATSYYNIQANGSSYQTVRTFTLVTDDLTSTSTTNALSANQGKVLKDTIDGLAISGAGAPTTSTVGTVGKLYEDTTNGKLYICTDTTGGTYTWTEVGAGGGGSSITELSSADYNYPTNNPTTVALWLLPDGVYSAPDGVSVRATTSLFASRGIYIVAKDFEDSSTVLKNILVYSSVNTVYRFVRVNTSTGVASADTGLAILDDIYADGSTETRIRIGDGSGTAGQEGVSIGHNAQAGGSRSIALGASAGAGVAGDSAVAIGRGTSCNAQFSVALGAFSAATTSGQVSIGMESGRTQGYNSTQYRLLSGLYDGQSAHDAATLAQGNTLATAAPTTATVGVLGQLYTDTTNMHTYQLGSIDETDPSNPVYNWVQRW